MSQTDRCSSMDILPVKHEQGATCYVVYILHVCCQNHEPDCRKRPSGLWNCNYSSTIAQLCQQLPCLQLLPALAVTAWQVCPPPLLCGNALLCKTCRSVDKNRLTGSIPPSWSQLHNLYVVNLTSNEGLCGQVPHGVVGVVENNTTNLNSHCTWTDDGEAPGRLRSVWTLLHAAVWLLVKTAVQSPEACTRCRIVT